MRLNRTKLFSYCEIEHFRDPALWCDLSLMVAPLHISKFQT
jgi:hypothetical protein